MIWAASQPANQRGADSRSVASVRPSVRGMYLSHLSQSCHIRIGLRGRGHSVHALADEAPWVLIFFKGYGPNSPEESDE